ncbi:MAG TPA: AAA family ATPase [Acidimicrobiia bacterium]|nr:AAA family ATPase [Acidimicrobiia bacterium]
MLEHLRVANLGVLVDEGIDPEPGFTVITGETGAGKTLLLGGIRLILGGPADAKTVGPYGDVAEVDGLFSIDDTELGAGRRIPSTGRSRAYLDGVIVSAAALAERLGSVVEIVGQHDQLAITRPAAILEMIDGALDDDGLRALESYRSAWAALGEALARQAQLGGDQMELTREMDLARYQAREIDAAGLKEGIDRDLEATLSRLRNIEEITEHLGETMGLSESMSESVGELVSRLRKAASLDPSLADLAGQADGLAEMVTDLVREARDALDGVDADPSALDETEQRLTAIGDLKRKYGRTVEEVLAYGARQSERASELETLLRDADEIDSLVSAGQEEVARRARALTVAREAAGQRISTDARGHLADLGLGAASVAINLETVDPGPSGADRAALMFASDDRLEPGPVSAVASGGELSRLVLALRLATRRATTATLVFDEVDTGIGGRTALAMGAKIAQLADDTQVLCVTHLPQVAAHADKHYVVERNTDGVARVRAVAGDDRLTELSRMLAGQPDSEAGKSAAAELLAIAKN